MTNSPKTGRFLAFALTLTLVVGPALAQRGELRGHPGFVDGGRLAELVPNDLPDAEVVEVNLAGPLLSTLTPLLNEKEPGLGEVVNELHGITAVVVSGLDQPSVERAREVVDEMARELGGAGWERLVRVREKGGRTLVLLHYSGESIDGLTVLGYQLGETNEVTFVNIAGLIDLASLSKLGDSMNLPGLDEAAKAAE